MLLNSPFIPETKIPNTHGSIYFIQEQVRRAKCLKITISLPFVGCLLLNALHKPLILVSALFWEKFYCFQRLYLIYLLTIVGPLWFRR